MDNLEEKVIGWCGYCKFSILKGDSYTVGENDEIFHPECYTQMSTYVEPFDFGDEG